MTDTLQQALDTPGCERLRDFAAVGPAQKAALELFVDRLRAADQQAEPVQWLDVIGAVGRGWRRTGNTRKQMDPDLALAIADEVKALYTAPPKAAPEATQYIALCDAMGYNERTDSLTSPEEHAKSLVAEIKRLKEQARPMTEKELHSVLQQVAESLGDVSIVMTHWPQVARAIEARKARPMTDEEMILRGWRRCAVGQRTTQYCGQVQKAVAAEREACAKVCEREGIGRKALEHYAALTYSGAAHDCAVAIRARGEK